MAGKARQADKGPDGAHPEADRSTAPGGGGTTEPEQVRPEQPAEARPAGRRTATLTLPFVTAQFHAPELRAPTREDFDAAAREARSMLPSRKSLLFYGGLAASAVAGIIEWPVAAAIGVGTALAGQGAANPAPGGAAAQPTGGATTESRAAPDQKA
jgi:hypothetical protein